MRAFTNTRVRIAATLLACLPVAAMAQSTSGYQSLVNLFKEWREFEHPVMKGQVPDYGAGAMAAKVQAMVEWHRRLNAIDTAGWPVAELTDYKLVEAELNGFDFNLKTLQ